MALPNTNTAARAVKRIRIWYGLLIILVLVFGLRLFYVQVIRYGHYENAALSDQLKQYQIPATRGLIEAQDDGQVVPIVLNQTLYTLYADPAFIKNPETLAAKVAAVIGGNTSSYATAMKTKNTEYVVLAKQLTPAQSDQILAMKSPGLGTEGQDYRTYPQGSLAAQVLGFVNNSGIGEYGVEQDLNKELSGTPGQVKAVTDASGVPQRPRRATLKRHP